MRDSHRSVSHISPDPSHPFILMRLYERLWNLSYLRHVSTSCGQSQLGCCCKCVYVCVISQLCVSVLRYMCVCYRTHKAASVFLTEDYRSTHFLAMMVPDTAELWLVEYTRCWSKCI